MSRAEREFDRKMRTELEAHSATLARTADDLRQASNVGGPRSVAVDDILKVVRQAVQECQIIARDHGMGTIKASDDTVTEVARVLGQADETLAVLTDYLDVAWGRSRS